MQELSSKGINITYRERTDGSILITSINGQKFEGAKGNATARELTGNNLPDAFRQQLADIKPQLGASPASRKQEPLTPTLKAKIAKAQRIWRNKGMNTKGTGKITTKRIRQLYQQYGEEEASRALNEKIRYAKGIAYSKNVEIQAQKLDSLANQFRDSQASSDLHQIAQYMRDNSESIKEEDLERMIEESYSSTFSDASAEQNYVERLKAIWPQALAYNAT